jgi:hypothetical protein
MENFLAILLQARTVAHIHHWKVKSFALHLALGELYELLTEFADELAEMYMGKGRELGTLPMTEPHVFAGLDMFSPIGFIGQLFTFLEDAKDQLPQDTWLINKYEELVAAVARVKYRAENLK